MYIDRHTYIFMYTRLHTNISQNRERSSLNVKSSVNCQPEYFGFTFFINLSLTFSIRTKTKFSSLSLFSGHLLLYFFSDVIHSRLDFCLIYWSSLIRDRVQNYYHRNTTFFFVSEKKETSTWYSPTCQPLTTLETSVSFLFVSTNMVYKFLPSGSPIYYRGRVGGLIWWKWKLCTGVWPHITDTVGWIWITCNPSVGESCLTS